MKSLKMDFLNFWMLLLSQKLFGLNFLGEMYPKSALNVAIYDNHNENICLAPFSTFWNFFYQRTLDFNFATIHGVGHPIY
jgi:hypothetical protein